MAAKLSEQREIELMTLVNYLRWNKVRIDMHQAMEITGIDSEWKWKNIKNKAISRGDIVMVREGYTCTYYHSCHSDEMKKQLSVNKAAMATAMQDRQTKLLRVKAKKTPEALADYMAVTNKAFTIGELKSFLSIDQTSHYRWKRFRDKLLSTKQVTAISAVDLRFMVYAHNNFAESLDQEITKKRNSLDKADANRIASRKAYYKDKEKKEKQKKKISAKQVLKSALSNSLTESHRISRMFDPYPAATWHY